MPCPKVVSRERSRREKDDKCLYKDRANPTGKVTEGASYTDSILKGDTVRYQNISWCKGIVCKVTSNFLNCSGIWTYLEKMETVILLCNFLCISSHIYNFENHMTFTAGRCKDPSHEARNLLFFQTRRIYNSSWEFNVINRTVVLLK